MIWLSRPSKGLDEACLGPGQWLFRLSFHLPLLQPGSPRADQQVLWTVGSQSTTRLLLGLLRLGVEGLGGVQKEKRYSWDILLWSSPERDGESGPLDRRGEKPGRSRPQFLILQWETVLRITRDPGP